MKHLVTTALCLLALAMPVSAREWYRPAHAGQGYVNSDLTPERVASHPSSPSWNGQLVLWEGTAERITRKGATTQVLLRTGAGTIPVNFPKAALTLDQDRTGYRMAIKAELKLQGSQIQGLTGYSAILLGPPKPWTLRQGAQVRDFLAWWVGFHNPQYPARQVYQIADGLLKESASNGIDPLLLASLVQVESAFKVDAVSVSGAVGLGQLMPFVADGLGVDPWDPAQNLKGAARMLSGLLQNWSGHENPRALALASYNAGPTLVRNLGSVPRISQTTNYVYFIGFVYEHMRATALASGVNLN